MTVCTGARQKSLSWDRQVLFNILLQCTPRSSALFLLFDITTKILYALLISLICAVCSAYRYYTGLRRDEAVSLWNWASKGSFVFLHFTTWMCTLKHVPIAVWHLCSVFSRCRQKEHQAWDFRCFFSLLSVLIPGQCAKTDRDILFHSVSNHHS